MTVNSTIIIPTRNRNFDLHRTLYFVTKSAGKRRRIIVVDSSSIETTNTDTVHRYQNQGYQVKHIHSCPGLPLQRLIGFLTSRDESEIIHFVDDDVDVALSYFETIESIFKRNPQIVGIGANQLNSAPSKESIDIGKVSRNGSPQGLGRIFANSKVGWLPGCAMSYRVKAIFEEDFPIGFNDYALFEDVYLSCKVSRRGVLILSADAMVIHRYSSVNRLQEAKLAFFDVTNRFKLVSDNPDIMKLSYMWIHLFSKIARNVSKALFSSRRRAILKAQLSGLISCLYPKT